MEKKKQDVKLDSNIKKIAELRLGEEKLNLMKDSIFSSLSSIVNTRESSATLVEVLSRYYNTSTKSFELPNGIPFSFCSKEVADIIGMRDDGMDVQVLVKQCAQSTCSFPPKALSKATAAELKEKLGEMAVEDEESKKCFKELLSYFLVEQVLLCGRDAKKLRVRYWPLVENAELREKCNWAKATWNQLHTSIADLKTWSMKKATGQQTSVQHAFTGAAPILEVCLWALCKF